MLAIVLGDLGTSFIAIENNFTALFLYGRGKQLMVAFKGEPTRIAIHVMHFGKCKSPLSEVP